MPDNASPSSPLDRRADHECIQRVLKGDRAALDEIARRLQVVPRIVNAINARRGHPFSAEDLEDLAQDALVKIWQKLDTFAGAGTLEGWIHGFALYEFMNRLRRLSRDPRKVSADPDAFGGQLARTARFPELVERLQGLDRPKAMVIELRHFEGLTFEQISERLDLPLNTVKARYYRGLTWLRERLQRPLQEERR